MTERAPWIPNSLDNDDVPAWVVYLAVGIIVLATIWLAYFVP